MASTAWYRTGTIALAQNSVTVTGTGTQWNNPLYGVAPGQMLLVPGAGTVVMYEIQRVVSDTQITLATAYTGSAATGQQYAIITALVGSVADFSRQLSVLVNQWQSQLDGWQQILSGTGDVKLTAPDGSTVTVKSQAALTAAINDTLNKSTTTTQTVAGAVEFKKNITSNGDQLLRATVATPNILLRFLNVDNVEKGAVFSDTSTGTISMRWSGSTYTMQGRTDGFVSHPRGATMSAVLGAVDIVTLSTGLGNSPISFRGNDTASFSETNNYNIGTWNGFSVVPTIGTGLSTGVQQGKPVFYVNARTGNTYALNGLFVGDKPVVTSSNSQTRIIPPHINSIGAKGYIKLAQMAPTETGASGFLFAVGNGKGYGTTGIDYKLVFFSTRQATTTSLYTRGVQVLSTHGFAYGSTVNINFGTLYNSTSGMWELWMTGPAYNVPSVQLIGNESGSGPITGVTYDVGQVWSTTAPSGLVIAAETPVYTGFNTTVDGNGFLKAASPIVKLFGDGTSELNSESQSVTTERISEGVYRVSGTLGFNSDAEWGGIDGGIEIPTDRNKLPLVWVDYEVDESGDLLIKTFHRANSSAPAFAKNTITGYKDGDPIDIPAGRWLDLRVQVYGAEPEPKVASLADIQPITDFDDGSVEEKRAE